MVHTDDEEMIRESFVAFPEVINFSLELDWTLIDLEIVTCILLFVARHHIHAHVEAMNLRKAKDLKAIQEAPTEAKNA